MLVLTNGQIITETEILTNYALVIKNDRIHSIVPEESIVYFDDYELIDANGGFISPGFIDIHSDYIESMISPRPTSLMDFSLGIREAEKILINHGITTMFHSLSIYKDDGFSHKPIRNPQNVNRLIQEIYETDHEEHLIRNRTHARFEIDNIGEVDRFIETIRDEKVHLISFMDHSPGQGQYRNLEIYRETLKGYRDLSDEKVEEIISNGKQKDKITLEQIKEISALAVEKNIAIASHDDDEEAKLLLAKSFGTTISEFPINLHVAQKAKELGLWTVVGAPNVMLGKSHSGNLCATEAILATAIDILCSDYYPASLLHAVFKMNEEHQIDLHTMFQMVTLNPAKAVRCDGELGSIREGKKADIIIIEKTNDAFPTVTTTIIDGKITTRTAYR